jgi:hypothetical protein
MWAEGVWTKSNDYFLPILEEEAATLDPVEVQFLDLFAKNKSKIYSDLSHMPLEKIRERFPKTCEFTDPAIYCHGLEQDIRMVSFILKKPN